MKKMRFLLFPLLLLTAGLAFAACGSSDDLKVEDAWARATAPTATTGAIYATIEGGNEADKLTAAAVPTEIAGKTEVHETKAVEPAGEMKEEADPMDEHGEHGDSGGTMKMQQIHELPVPADGQVKLEPGGFHIMLFDLAAPLEVGQVIPVTLTFENAGEIKVDATVRED